MHAQEQTARKEENKGFTKHVLRLRHERDLAGFSQVGQRMHELVLMNSHDGTTSYRLDAGIFEMVCSNKMVVCSSTLDTIKCRHSGNVVNDVIEGSYRIIENAHMVADSIARFESVKLSDQEQLLIADAALSLRCKDEEQTDDNGEIQVFKTAPIEASQLVRPMRYAQQASNLWNTANIIQEHVIRGGDRGVKIETDERGRRTVKRTTTRAVNSITEADRLNKAIWRLTEEMAKLKGAA
jgi:hypothetical protein